MYQKTKQNLYMKEMMKEICESQLSCFVEWKRKRKQRHTKDDKQNTLFWTNHFFFLFSLLLCNKNFFSPQFIIMQNFLSNKKTYTILLSILVVHACLFSRYLCSSSLFLFSLSSRFRNKQKVPFSPPPSFFLLPSLVLRQKKNLTSCLCFFFFPFFLLLSLTIFFNIRKIKLLLFLDFSDYRIGFSIFFFVPLLSFFFFFLLVCLCVYDLLSWLSFFIKKYKKTKTKIKNIITSKDFKIRKLFNFFLL